MKKQRELFMQAQGHSNDFQTPPHAIAPILKYINPDWVVWECACGKGNLVNEFQRLNYKVIGSDIITGNDFLSWCPEKYDCIITNPPYSLKEKFLQRAYEIKKPFAFLLPLTTFESEKRQKLFREFGLEVIFLNKRINFETPSGKGGGSWFATAWFTNWMNIGNPLTFEIL